MYGETKRDLVEIINKLCEMKQVELLDGSVCVDHILNVYGNTSPNKYIRIYVIFKRKKYIDVV